MYYVTTGFGVLSGEPIDAGPALPGCSGREVEEDESRADGVERGVEHERRSGNGYRPCYSVVGENSL